MRQISYSDRASILKIVQEFKSAAHIPDNDLLRTVSDYLRQYNLAADLGHALVGDVVALCNYLRTSTNEQVRATARASLLYLLKQDDVFADAQPDTGFHDDAYVVSLALHEIRQLSGTAAGCGVPDLTDDERRHIERRLEALRERPTLPDSEILEGAERVRHVLQSISRSGYFARMCGNIGLLMDRLTSHGRPDALRWARAGLNYLAEHVDVIPDELGIVGYLDDGYALDTAVNRADPDRNPWPDILDDTTRNWPFLNWVIIRDGSYRTHLSEFMLANAAAALRLPDSQDQKRPLGIVVPLPGPLPFMLAFLSAVAIVHKTASADPSSLCPQKGQRVLVDGRSIRVFDGFETVAGKPMFRLTQHRRDRGQTVAVTDLWPLDQLARILPADSERATRGQITYDLGRSDAPLRTIDRILHAAQPVRFDGSGPRLMMVAPIGETQALSKSMSLYSEPLCEVIPMGHVRSDGDVESWSSRWGQTPPVLTVTHSLDRAAELLDEDSLRASMVLINVQGALSRQAVSLQRMCRLDVPLVTIVAERDRHDLDLLGTAGFSLLEWTPNDFDSLQWSEPPAPQARSVLRSYESNLVRRARSRPEVRRLDCPEADSVLGAVHSLHCLARRREDGLAELDRFLAISHELMYRLFQTIVPLGQCPPLARRVDEGLAVLRSIVATSLFLSSGERPACEKVISAFDHLRQCFEHDCPKVSEIVDLFRDAPELTVICYDSKMADSACSYWASELALPGDASDDWHPRIIPCPAGSPACIPGPAVAAGWFGMNRMSRLLQPPVSERLVLLLYNLEAEACTDFLRMLERARARRASSHARERMFGGTRRWQAAAGRGAVVPAAGSGLAQVSRFADLDLASDGYRQRSILDGARAGSTGEAEVSAWAVWFTDGSHAFLTDGYRAKSVTHLIDGTVTGRDADSAQVYQIPRDDVVPGQHLLFHRGSDADAIRVLAEEILGTPAIRTTAKLWQQALRQFQKREWLTPQEVWNRLRKAGCDHHCATIRNWLEDDDIIAPRDAHSHELRIIASVTRDRDLLARMQECDMAIRDVWGAHLSASSHLAKMVLDRVMRDLSENGVRHVEGLLELDPTVVVAEVAQIHNQPVTVRRSLCNRLIEG